jgi:hypothetical protein
VEAIIEHVFASAGRNDRCFPRKESSNICSSERVFDCVVHVVVSCTSSCRSRRRVVHVVVSSSS